MKTDKIIYLFMGTYLISYLFLVFKVIEEQAELKQALGEVKSSLGMGGTSVTLLICFTTLILASLIYLIYYQLMRFVVTRICGDRPKDDRLSAALLLSETLCAVSALFLLDFFAMEAVGLIIPAIGLATFFWLSNELRLSQLTYSCYIGMNLILSFYHYLGVKSLTAQINFDELKQMAESVNKLMLYANCFLSLIYMAVILTSLLKERGFPSKHSTEDGIGLL